MDATRFLASLERARLCLVVPRTRLPQWDGDTAPGEIAEAHATLTTVIETVQAEQRAEQIAKRYPAPAELGRVERVRSAAR
jgi:hypothetical protein